MAKWWPTEADIGTRVSFEWESRVSFEGELKVHSGIGEIIAISGRAVHIYIESLTHQYRSGDEARAILCIPAFPNIFLALRGVDTLTPLPNSILYQLSILALEEELDD